MLSIMTTGFYDKDDDHDNKYPCLSSDHCRRCVGFSLGHFVLGCRAFDVLGKESWVDPYRPPDRQVLNRKAYRKPYRAVIGFAPG